MEDPIDFLLGNKNTFKIKSYNTDTNWYVIISQNDNMNIYMNNFENYSLYINKITKDEVQKYIEKEKNIKLKFTLPIKDSNNIIKNVDKFVNYYKNKNIEVEISYKYRY